MLCAIAASAVSYASPYKGAGRSGYTSGYHMHTTSGYAQMPTASMRSTSNAYGIRSTAKANVQSIGSGGGSYAGGSYTGNSTTRSSYKGPQATTVQAINVQGFYTCASAIRGGVMSGNTYAQMNRIGSPRKSPTHPDDAEECEECIDANGDGVCDVCGCDMDNCTCAEESGYCWCPLDFDGIAMLYMAMMALGYAVIARKRKDERVTISK